MFYIAWGIFGVAALVFIVFGIIITYHLLRYRFAGDASVFMASMYVIVAVIILVGAAVSMVRTDWSTFGINLGSAPTAAPVQRSGPLFENE